MNAGDRPLKVLGLAEGDPRTAISGVAGGVFGGIARRCQLLATLDYSLAGMARLALAAETVRPSRERWRARFHTSLLAQRALSRTLAARLRQAPTNFDVALQVFGWVIGQPRPYTVYVDQTRLMAERGWPSWMPIARWERSRILKLERYMYQRAGHLFTMGEPARESLVDDYGFSPVDVTVAGGGLNLEHMPSVTARPATPTILFVGRDFERKGGDCLLRAFARVYQELPDAELRIVGVERRFTQDGVVSYGRLADRVRLQQLYRTSSVFCMPSRYEPWGLAFVEAMAHGIPCVGSNVQSIPEILGHGEAGLSVEPGDPKQLTDALLMLLTDDALANRMGLAGRRLVEQTHSWDRVAERMLPGLRRAATRS